MVIHLTIIANAEKNLLHIGIGNEDSLRLLSSVFTRELGWGNADHLLVMTQELQDRLSILKAIGAASYPAKLFFQQVPIGNHFLIINGHVEDQIRLIRYTDFLARIDGARPQFHGDEQLLAYFEQNYEVRCFHGEERKNIGEYDRKKRVCRFCGKSIPNTTFNHKAHALSECLGNKNLICREECDECNTRFSRTIEPSVANLFHFYLILSNTKGKHGRMSISVSANMSSALSTLLFCHSSRKRSIG